MSFVYMWHVGCFWHDIVFYKRTITLMSDNGGNYFTGFPENTSHRDIVSWKCSGGGLIMPKGNNVEKETWLSDYGHDKIHCTTWSGPGLHFNFNFTQYLLSFMQKGILTMYFYLVKETFPGSGWSGANCTSH